MAQEGEQDGGRLPPTTTQAFLFPHTVVISSSQDQREMDQLHGQQTEPLGLFPESGSSDTVSSTADSKIVGQSSPLQHCREDVRGSVGSMCSEMNASEKSSPDQELQQLDMKGCNRSSSRGGGCAVIKTCSSCSTTKTPLWRSGPKGPKSLCNACGIRQRKARRAMEAAAAAAGSGLVAACKVRKEKKTDGNCILPYKKRYSKIINAAAAAASQVDDMMVRLSKSSAFCQVLPQDEKDAAVLLMALSCGLIHG